MRYDELGGTLVGNWGGWRRTIEAMSGDECDRKGQIFAIGRHKFENLRLL